MFDVLHQPGDARLEVDDEVGLDDVVLDTPHQGLVQLELFILEVQVRKDLVLLEYVVGDKKPVKQVCLRERALLLVAGQEEEDLCLEGVPLRILVEILEKRVFFELLHHDAGAQRLPQQRAERRFPGAGDPLDGDIAHVGLSDQLLERILSIQKVSGRLQRYSRPRSA